MQANTSLRQDGVKNICYEMREGDNAGSFAVKIAEVLESKNSERYFAKTKEGEVSVWQVVAEGGENPVLELRLCNVTVKGGSGTAKRIPYEEIIYSAIEEVFQKNYGTGFYPRGFEIELKGRVIGIEGAVSEAYALLVKPGKEPTPPKPPQLTQGQVLMMSPV